MSGYSNLYRRERDLDMPALAAFDEREEKREVKRLARLQAEGYTQCICSQCGDTRSLAWANEGCNNTEFDAPCEGVFKPVRGAQ